MKILIKKLIIGIFVLLKIGCSTLNACSCDTISFKDALEYADEIFVGKIVKAERFENGKFLNADNQEKINWDWRYYFEVKKKWKGNNKSKLIVYHQGTSCDLFFDIYEREYLVYASRQSEEQNISEITIHSNNKKGKLTTWLCSRTIDNPYNNKESWFEDDIEKLEKEFPNEIQLSKSQVNISLIIITILGILGFVGLLIRRNLNNKKI